MQQQQQVVIWRGSEHIFTSRIASAEKAVLIRRVETEPECVIGLSLAEHISPTYKAPTALFIRKPNILLKYDCSE
jgi:hypothetical protein